MQNTRHLVVLVGATLMVLMLLIIMGFTIFNNLGDTPTPPAPEQVTETALSPEAELALQEQIAPLIAGGDMAACDEVQNDMYRKVCINNIALNKAGETKDIAYCQYLDGELISKEDCERKVVFQKSVETGDVSVCKEATTEVLQKECEGSFGLRLAMEKADPVYCAAAPDPMFCRDVVTFQTFMNDPVQTECSIFESREVIDDCNTVKPILSAPSQADQLMNICQELKSPIFAQFCISSAGFFSGMSELQ